MFCQSVIKMSRKVLTLSERVEAIKLHDGGKSSRDVAQIMGVGRTQIQQIIKRKSEVLDDYESNVSNDRKRKRHKTGNEEINDSFNSGIFVILKKLWTLNYRSPLLSSQFLLALMWLLKSSLTVILSRMSHWLSAIISPIPKPLSLISNVPLPLCCLPLPTQIFFYLPQNLISIRTPPHNLIL